MPDRSGMLIQYENSREISVSRDLVYTGQRGHIKGGGGGGGGGLVSVRYGHALEFPLDIIWRHSSASILGTTRTVTRAPMLMYWAGLSRIASPRERRSK